MCVHVICISKNIYTYIHIYLSDYTQMYIYVYVYVYIYINVCTYSYIYRCIHICIYMYMYTRCFLGNSHVGMGSFGAPSAIDASILKTPPPFRGRRSRLPEGRISSGCTQKVCMILDTEMGHVGVPQFLPRA